LADEDVHGNDGVVKSVFDKYSACSVLISLIARLKYVFIIS